MRIGIMQPYFLPYIGYWQLLAAVDTYVVYDDVNFIKGGWINRNRVLVQGVPRYINVQMTGSSPFKLIKDVGVNPSEVWRKKLLSTIRMSYAKAPYFTEIFPVIQRIVCSQEKSLAKYLYVSLCEMKSYLDIKTKLILSSEMEQDRSLHGEERVIDICLRIGATEYINAIGGMNIYNEENFANEGICLRFLQSVASPYRQFDYKYIPNLSLVDVLMFNGKKKTKEMLEQYMFTDRVQMQTGGVEKPF